jgi:hypothetical protein
MMDVLETIDTLFDELYADLQAKSVDLEYLTEKLDRARHTVKCITDINNNMNRMKNRSLIQALTPMSSYVSDEE